MIIPFPSKINIFFKLLQLSSFYYQHRRAPLRRASPSLQRSLFFSRITRIRSYFFLFLQNKQKIIYAKSPKNTIYILNIRTKLGCGEGGCGACTVTISRMEQGTLIHRGVNACLAPLCSVDSCHVTTVEGIGTQSNPHPVQERISSCHGSQCGYCTPGIVMALYSKLQSNPTPTVSDIEETFDGNLCRCTGYRPILDAAKTFAIDVETAVKAPKNIVPTSNNETGNQKIDVITTTVSKLQHTSTTNGDPTLLPGPPTLPLECIALAKEPLTITDGDITWHRPSTLNSLLELKTKYPDAKLITGNTEVGIETRFKNLHYSHLIHTIGVEELCSITNDVDGTIHVGGAVTLAQLEHYLIHLFENVEQGKEFVFECSLDVSKNQKV